MKLLIVTQKVNDTDRNLGFFIQWIKKFAEHAEVTVIANEVGPHNLPTEVQVFSLGKEKGASRFARFVRYQELLFRLLPDVDGVFFHMCPEYVLGAHFFPLLAGKKSILWYVHKEVSLRLRFASWFVTRIFTASASSCRLKSKKVEVVGHGISTELFSSSPKSSNALNLVTVGRITPAKDLETLILAFKDLKRMMPRATLTVVGEPITPTDQSYAGTLQKLSSDVQFTSLPYGAVFAGGHPFTVFVHASKTGSIDKAVLEALSAGLPVFSSSEAFSDIPGVWTFREGDAHDLALKIAQAFHAKRLGVNEVGRRYVSEMHSLDRLIKKIQLFYA